MEQEVVDLSRRLKVETGYYAPRLEPEHLEAAIREGRAVIRRKDGRIEAFAALWPTNEPACRELGTVWIGEGLRGNGLRDELMAELVQRVPKDFRLFLITSVEPIMRSAEKLGFKAVTTKTHPKLLWWAACVHVVCRLPCSIHPIATNVWGTPKAGKRWLFWLEGT